MTKILEFLGINSKTKFQFMSWIGAVFISFYLFSGFYDMLQMNYFFNKGKIDVEVYERLKLSYYRDLYSVVTIIVLYFFKNSNDKQNENNGL